MWEAGSEVKVWRGEHECEGTGTERYSPPPLTNVKWSGFVGRGAEGLL
jgi:hypothetical protein